MAEFLVAEWYEWVEVTLARYHLVRDDGGKKQDNACKITPELENGSQDQADEPEKLDRISKLITGVRIVRYGDKCHIQHDLGIEPPALDRKFPENQCGHDTQGCRQHVWSVDCCKPQAVDCKL